MFQEFFVKRFTEQAALQARLDQRKTVMLKDAGESTQTDKRVSVALFFLLV